MMMMNFRPLLQYDTCMQMLSNIVQTSEQAVQSLYSSGLIHHLRDFLHLYGPYTQVSFCFISKEHHHPFFIPVAFSISHGP